MSAVTRYSRQRELIYQCVQMSREHPTAEMVYEQLRPTNPNLSLGTVYRNLKLLSGLGQLKQLSFNVDRYDADLSAHAHLCCTVCGQVVDLEGDCTFLVEQFQRNNPGSAVEDCTLVFRGRCADCVGKNLPDC